MLAVGQKPPFCSRPQNGHCKGASEVAKAAMSSIAHRPNEEIARIFPIALLIAFLLHNAEEAITYGSYRETSQALIRTAFFHSFSAPSTDSFHGALLAVSAVGSVAMIWARLNPSRPAAAVLVRGLALLMLGNVFIPHVPAAILFGGYAPGVVTAVLLNVPIAGFVLVCLQRAAPV